MGDTPDIQQVVNPTCSRQLHRPSHQPAADHSSGRPIRTNPGFVRQRDIFIIPKRVHSVLSSDQPVSVGFDNIFALLFMRWYQEFGNNENVDRRIQGSEQTRQFNRKPGPKTDRIINPKPDRLPGRFAGFKRDRFPAGRFHYHLIYSPPARPSIHQLII